jgi:acetolactate synthase I/II/III large subunit
MPEGLCSAGALFHHATVLEAADELPELLGRLEQGFRQPGGFVAHVGLPLTVMTGAAAPLPPSRPCHLAPLAPSAETLRRVLERLSERPFGIWAGFGARGAAKAVRELAERTGAPVFCSPRAKGIFPEDHPLFGGVTGFAGHESVEAVLHELQPHAMLVLGTRLGEFTSFWLPELLPPGGLVHVDLDPSVPGAAYPDAPTLGVHADVGAFLDALLERLPRKPWMRAPRRAPLPVPLEPRSDGRVRPEALMQAIQAIVVEGSDAVVMTEAGTAFAWGTHHLRFDLPGRYRTSMGFGSMGHAAAGVLGAALARQGKAVAILGDGAMLMNSELATAVRSGIPAVWVVLNDSCYGMVEQGMRQLGLQQGADPGLDLPATDFVQIARAIGADGARVERETEIEPALRAAMAARGPFVVDTVVERGRPAPFGSRAKSLAAQGLGEV